MVEGQLTTSQDDDPEYPWMAMFKSKEYGTFFGYGKTKQEAINKLQQTINSLIR